MHSFLFLFVCLLLPLLFSSLILLTNYVADWAVWQLDSHVISHNFESKSSWAEIKCSVTARWEEHKSPQIIEHFKSVGLVVFWGAF